MALEATEVELVAPQYDAGELAGPGEATDDLSFTMPAFETATPSTADSRGESDRFRRDLDDLERRIASMGLVGDSPQQTQAQEPKPVRAAARCW